MLEMNEWRKNKEQHKLIEFLWRPSIILDLMGFYSSRLNAEFKYEDLSFYFSVIRFK